MYGYISEHHGYGKDEIESGDYAEDLAATILASTLGIDFDPDAAWNERKHVYETSSLIIESKSVWGRAPIRSLQTHNELGDISFAGQCTRRRTLDVSL